MATIARTIYQSYGCSVRSHELRFLCVCVCFPGSFFLSLILAFLFYFIFQPFAQVSLLFVLCLRGNVKWFLYVSFGWTEGVTAEKGDNRKKM